MCAASDPALTAGMVDVAESGSDSGSEDMSPAATEDDPASDQAVSALSVPVWLQRPPPWRPLGSQAILIYAIYPLVCRGHYAG